MSGSHTVLHAGLSQSGQIKNAPSVDPQWENFVVKLNELGQFSEVFIPREIDTVILVATRDGVTTDQYLKFGEVYSSVTGVRLPRDFTLISLSTQNAVSSTYDIQIRKNDALADLETLSVAAATGAHDTSYSLALTAGDRLQVYCDGTADSPVVFIELQQVTP